MVTPRGLADFHMGGGRRKDCAPYSTYSLGRNYAVPIIWHGVLVLIAAHLGVVAGPSLCVAIEDSVCIAPKVSS